MNEYVIFAQMRSGHHAIINWFRYQLPGLHVFLNACKPNMHPLKSCSINQSRIGWGESDIRARNVLLYPTLNLHLIRSVLYNYEEITPLANQNAWFNSSGKIKQIVVLRSPANLLASRLKWELTVRSKFDTITDEILDERLKNTINTWLKFAEIYLSNNYQSIYYDKWFVDTSYKIEIMNRIGEKHKTIHKDNIAKWGPGSSFDLNTNIPPSELDLLNRWKIYRNDSCFINALNNDEVKKFVTLIDGESESSKWIQSL